MDLKRALIDFGAAAALPAKKARVEAGPSAVLFFWNLPVGTTELDLTQLCTNFGTPVCTLKLKEKNQGFVEMGSVQSASDMLEYYRSQSSKPIIRGEAVDVQFSSRSHISKKEETGSSSSSVMQNMMVLPGAFPMMAQAQAAGLPGAFPSLPGQAAQILNPVTGLGLATVVPIPDLPGRILHINITNPTHPVSPDILYYVFSQYGGTILRIVCFEKNNVQQALIEFSDANAALVAKSVLQDHSVFTDGCVLRIDHSKLSTVNVRAGDPNSRDYSAGLGLSLMGSPALSGAPLALSQASSLFSAAQPQARAPAEGAGKCILVSNLSIEKVTPLALFKLFGTCGDVMRVKILFNKRDNALIQFRNEAQASQAVQLMQNVPLFGAKLRIAISRLATVALPPPGSAELFEGLTQDYENSPLHRFKNPGSRNEQNIAMPSESLHVANILETAEEQSLVQLFSAFGLVVAFKFLPNTRKMASVRYSTTESAVSALIALHGASEAAEGFAGDSKGLMISFSKAGTGM